MFHIRYAGCGRAFHPRPKSLCAAIVMYQRGWRPFPSGGWWSKPSGNQKRFEARSLRSMTDDDFNEVHSAADRVSMAFVTAHGKREQDVQTQLGGKQRDGRPA